MNVFKQPLCFKFPSECKLKENLACCCIKYILVFYSAAGLPDWFPVSIFLFGIFMLQIKCIL